MTYDKIPQVECCIRSLPLAVLYPDSGLQTLDSRLLVLDIEVK